jgi:hypothetical protein
LIRSLAALAVAALAGAAIHAGDGVARAAGEPEFMFAPTLGVGAFDGFGV